MQKLYIILLFLFSGLINSAEKNMRTGILAYEFGDPEYLRTNVAARYYLQTDTKMIELEMSQAFKKTAPIHMWLGKQVNVVFKDNKDKAKKRKVQLIELIGNKQSRGAGVTGAQPWVSILCKFSDKPVEPENLAFFNGMYANLEGGLDHYWRQVSYDKINIAGSKAIDWVDLPSTQSTYTPTPGSGSDADLTALFNDCTAAADPFIDYSDNYVGINMMFNDVLDCCAWGGGRFAELDGLTKLWRVTWEPPWSYDDEGIIAHEMGHGFGLPHANNFDLDSSPYDNPWDVMSAAQGNAVNDPIYGRLGKHINMEHKRKLNWVNDLDDGFVASTLGSETTITIDRSNLQTTSNKRFALLPLLDGNYYIIEAREKAGTYEGNLAGTAIIIHHVDNSRNEPAWVVDADEPVANYSNTEGVMWKVGETFIDSVNGYSVEVLAETAEGFSIKITVPLVLDLIFKNGFE